MQRSLEALATLAPLFALLLGAGGMGGLWAYLNKRSGDRAKVDVAKEGAPAAIVNATAALQQAVNEAAADLMHGLRNDIEELRKAAALREAELEARERQLEAELEAVRQRIGSLEEENLQCRGENRQLTQKLESLETLLRKAGVDIPGRLPAGALVYLDGDNSRVMAPEAAPDSSAPPPK